MYGLVKIGVKIMGTMSIQAAIGLNPHAKATTTTRAIGTIQNGVIPGMKVAGMKVANDMIISISEVKLP